MGAGHTAGAPSPSTGAQTLLLVAPRPRASLCPQTRALPGSGTAVGFRFLPLLPLRPLRPTSQWPPASPGRGVVCRRVNPQGLTRVDSCPTTHLCNRKLGPQRAQGPHLEPACTNQPTPVQTPQQGVERDARCPHDGTTGVKSGPLGRVRSPPERKHLGSEALEAGPSPVMGCKVLEWWPRGWSNSTLLFPSPTLGARLAQSRL